MNTIYLIRYGISTEGGVLGKLVYGDKVSYTLEPSHTKPYHEGHPCIPEGRYPIVLSVSTRFKRLLPEIQDVPGRSGIRMHSGDTVKDSEGCMILFGKEWPIGRGTSRKSEGEFVAWMSSMGSGRSGKIYLEVINKIR